MSSSPVARDDSSISASSKEISISYYSRSSNPSDSPLIFAHGASGSMHTPAVAHFATGAAETRAVITFQGNMNLKSRVNQFLGVVEWYAGQQSTDGGEEKFHQGKTGVVLGGRSMGARAAVIAAMEVLASGSQTRFSEQLVLVSYPLVAPSGEVRDQILLDLPDSCEVLFIIGTRDNMCPIEHLQKVRDSMSAKSWLVIVDDADHGMSVRPKSAMEAVVGETGKVAVDWFSEKEDGKREGRIWVWHEEGGNENQVEWSGWTNDRISTGTDDQTVAGQSEVIPAKKKTNSTTASPKKKHGQKKNEANDGNSHVAPANTALLKSKRGRAKNKASAEHADAAPANNEKTSNSKNHPQTTKRGRAKKQDAEQAQIPVKKRKMAAADEATDPRTPRTNASETGGSRARGKDGSSGEEPVSARTRRQRQG